MTELLLSRGADVNAKAGSGQTPLHVASDRGIAELLLSHGADVNVKDNCGRTPLGVAVERGNKEMVELLKKHGAKE